MNDLKILLDTILIVDNEPNNIRPLFDLLINQGYRVMVAESGVGALEQLIYLKPNLILLDVIMPRMDGFVVCRHLKSQPETANIPVIFITSITDTESKIRGFELGGVDYITKPFQEIEVLARIHTHLLLYRLQTDLQQQVADQTNQLRQAHTDLKIINTTLQEKLILLE